MLRNRFRQDADLDSIISELDLRRARGVVSGNFAAIYDRVHDALPASDREATLAPLRTLITNAPADGRPGRGARRWITRHHQDLTDYNRYTVVRTLLGVGATWEQVSDAAEPRLGACARSVVKSYSRVRRALAAGDDGRYYFSRHLVIACDADDASGLRVVPNPELLNALPWR